MRFVWERPDLGEYLGYNGLHVHDLDGDGEEEILFTSTVPYGWGAWGGSRFFVMESTESGYAIAKASPLFTTDASRNESILWLAVRDSGAGTTIHVLLADGTVRLYDGATLAPVDTVSLDLAVGSASLTIVDVDDDGTDEYVVGSDQYVGIFDITTQALEWSTADAVRDVEVGDVDGDGRNEIVLGNGRVLDGATRDVQWTYPDGFGQLLTLANTDTDAALEIVAYNGAYSLVAFDGEFNTPLWELRLDNDLSALTATNARGAWEIITGPRQWGPVKSYVAATREAAWSINNPEYATTNLAVGDPDGDGTIEVVWGAGHYSSGQDVLAVGDPTAEAVEFQTEDVDGPFRVQVGDLDGDERLEIVAATESTRSGYSGGSVTAYDGATHARLWGYADIEGLDWYRGDFLGLGVSDASGDGLAEVYLSTDRQTLVIGGRPPRALWQNADQQDGTVFAFADIDGDGSVEVVMGNTSGQVTVLDGQTRAVEWQSISTAGEIGGIRLANLDDDAALEIAFFNANGRVRVYDGITHYLEWESSAISDATAFDIADLDLDGTKELLVGRMDGSILILEAGTFTTIDELLASGNDAITGLRVGNVDDDMAPEVLVASTTIRMLNWPEKEVVWESPLYGGGLGQRDALHIADVDDDGYMDVLAAGPYGLVQFEASVRYPDVVPPTLVATAPLTGTTQVSTDVAATFDFSEPLDAASLADGVRVLLADGTEINRTATLDADGDRLTVSPVGEWPGASDIEIVLSGTLSDLAGNGLDGNRNDIAEGSPDDDAVLAFRTGTGIDTVGAVIASISVQQDSVWLGVPLRLSAVGTDTSAVSTSGVAAAEYFLDTAGAEGTGTPLPPADGTYGEPFETFSFEVGTSSLGGGDHTVLVRAQDTRGAWGPLRAVSFFLITSDGSEWPQFAQNAQHTGFNPLDTLSAPFRVEWSTATTEDSYGLRPLIVANGHVYLTTGGYNTGMKVIALDEETGEERWSYAFGDVHLISMPAFAYGRVYVQTNNHTPGSYVWAFDAETGSVEWKSSFPAQWELGNAPTVAEGKVFVNGGYYGGMLAYDAFAGTPLWSLELPQVFDWSPTYADGMVYVGWPESGFYAVDSETGETEYTFGELVYWGVWPRTAAFRDSVLYTVNPLAAIDLRDQSVRWSKAGDDTPAIAYGKVFVITNGTLAVYDEATGRTLWTFRGDGQLIRAPVVANGYVFVSSDENTYALDIDEEASVWTYPEGGPLAIASGRLYLAGRTGAIYAFVNGGGTPLDPTGPSLPQTFAVSQNRPNPFSGRTTVAYALPDTAPVLIEVYNALGQRVTTLVDETMPAGTHDATWDASGVSAGVYYCRIRAGSETAVTTMSLVR